MPSMIELISEAEKKAADTKKEAGLEGRERIAKATAEGESSVAAARERARAEADSAETKAESEGRKLGEEIFAENAKKADGVLEAARTKLPEAAKYIIERVAER